MELPKKIIIETKKKKAYITFIENNNKKYSLVCDKNRLTFDLKIDNYCRCKHPLLYTDGIYLGRIKGIRYRACLRCGYIVTDLTKAKFVSKEAK